MSVEFEIKDLLIRLWHEKLLDDCKNPLNKHAYQCFSQSDEDGITLEIVRRLGIEKGTFCEFGVEDGLQNNSLILLASKWKGFWIDCKNTGLSITDTPKFSFIKEFVTTENVVSIVNSQKSKFNNIDLISIDLDGNDIHILRELLKSNILPPVYIVEYNSKFTPGIFFEIEYDEDFAWKFDDYFGASLSSFVETFSEYGYTLVCCNLYTGSNAFFIKNEFMHLFSDVPSSIEDLYIKPRFHLYEMNGHRTSLKTVEKFILDL